MARRAGAVTIETVSEQVYNKVFHSLTGRIFFRCPVTGPASYGCLALWRSLQKWQKLVEVVVGSRVGEIGQTWNSVVQDEPKESPDEHVCCEEHHDHLVQLFYSFKQRRLTYYLVPVAISMEDIWRLLLFWYNSWNEKHIQSTTNEVRQ